MNGRLKPWFQLFRAQTLPATLLVAMVPYLHGTTSAAGIAWLALGLAAAHCFSYGHNSLMDYHSDVKDPAKSHHPLITGEIPLRRAHVVIHWGLALAFVCAIVFTLIVSPAKCEALVALSVFCIFGHAYNDGLSKTTVFAFLPLAFCDLGLAAWAWFLSHPVMDAIGAILLAYYLVLFAFQISYSGCLKEIEIAEDSNLLIAMGARVENGIFRAGRAGFFGLLLKAAGLALGGALLALNFTWGRLIWWCVVSAGMAALTIALVRTRPWNRGRELMRMSLQEIAAFYLPIPILLDPPTAAILMAFGVVYFFAVNRWLWGKPYPAV